MRRFRAALLALGLLLVTAGVAAGALAERAGGDLDHDLSLAGASRVTAVDDYAERARAVTLVASHSAAFADFYDAPGSRDERIRGQAGNPNLMIRVHTALSDLGVLFPDDVASAGFVDRTGAENAAVVRGESTDHVYLSPDQSDLPFFDRTFELPYEKVYQSKPYRSPATEEWVVSFSAKVLFSADVAPAVIHFDVTVESFRLALYDEDPGYRVRVVDLLDGRVIIDSKHPQDVSAPLGQPDDRSLRWVQTARDGELRTSDGQRHVVERARAASNIATSWAVVVSVDELTGAWAGPTSLGPVSLLTAGLLLLAFSVVGYVRQGRMMHRAARRDELTLLHNRMSAREIADTLLVRERSLAVILFDLDRFKHVNDSLGHRAGDHLLAVIASRLAEVVREPDDVVARLGGDEFVVLARGLRDMAAVQAMCERISRAVTEPVVIDGLHVSVGASIGVALAPDHGSDFGVLLQSADIAMYDAKRRRTGWQVYQDDLARGDRAELELDADLRRAVDAGELEVHFQPSFSVATGELIRAEALVRWRHPARGLLMPAQFIALAEATGTIKAVTRVVLSQSLDQVVAWRTQGHAVPVSVNVSAHDVNDPAFADLVVAELAARGLPGSILTLELTETALLADPEAAALGLLRVVAAGVTIAVDDFGAGYASLLYLRRYPISVLKLDRSLVQGLTVNSTDAALVRWTVEMAHSLAVTCVAEGVEDAQTLAALADLGCDEAQGFFLQVPVPPEELAIAAHEASVR
ncbi:MAG TPA: bifunctional diguanylate cyclase/phosphodiesterase [Actinomycetes bacterium]